MATAIKDHAALRFVEVLRVGAGRTRPVDAERWLHPRRMRSLRYPPAP